MQAGDPPRAQQPSANGGTSHQQKPPMGSSQPTRTPGGTAQPTKAPGGASAPSKPSEGAAKPSGEAARPSERAAKPSEEAAKPSKPPGSAAKIPNPHYSATSKGRANLGGFQLSDSDDDSGSDEDDVPLAERMPKVLPVWCVSDYSRCISAIQLCHRYCLYYWEVMMRAPMGALVDSVVCRFRMPNQCSYYRRWMLCVSVRTRFQAKQ